jgi:hypothetical protein
MLQAVLPAQVRQGHAMLATSMHRNEVRPGCCNTASTTTTI